jgi:hypothetical protein
MKKKKEIVGTIDVLIKTAIETAANSNYCIECQYSYLRPDGMTGYCKYPMKADQMHPKTIEAYSTCQHWEKKC